MASNKIYIYLEKFPKRAGPIRKKATKFRLHYRIELKNQLSGFYFDTQDFQKGRLSTDGKLRTFTINLENLDPNEPEDKEKIDSGLYQQVNGPVTGEFDIRIGNTKEMKFPTREVRCKIKIIVTEDPDEGGSSSAGYGDADED